MGLDSAIQTRKVDSDRFPWEQPADRQRLESSLTEPFLLAIDGDPVLGREIVKRRK